MHSQPYLNKSHAEGREKKSVQFHVYISSKATDCNGLTPSVSAGTWALTYTLQQPGKIRAKSLATAIFKKREFIK